MPHAPQEPPPPSRSPGARGRPQVICSCTQRNPEGRLYCTWCEQALRINLTPPPPNAGESIEDYARRCGPIIVE